MPWKGTRLFISVFMKNPLLPLWALQIAAALIILKLHIAFALTEPRLIADVGLTDNRCRIRVSSCKPEAAPRGYTCCGPQAPGPLWLQPVERTGDVVSGSWAAGGAHRAGPPGQIAMNACLEFAGRACWDRCSRAGRDGSAAWDQSSMPNFFRRCWDEFLLLPSMQFEAVNFAWCSVDYTMELYKDIATLCRHMEEQCLTHLLHYQYKHSMWHYRKFYPLGFKLRRKILYRLWTCVGVFQLCLTLAIRGYHFPRSCYRMAKSLVSLCGLHGFRSTRPEPSASRTPTTSFSSESRPSPKSGGSGACGAVFKRILLRVLLLFHLNHPTAGARVVVDATATTGAHPHPQLTRPQTGWAKLSGEFSTVRPNFSNTRKRAYKRAVLRAQQHGSTWYRGRQHSYKQLANLENVMGNSEDPGRGTASQSNTSHTRPQDAPFQVLSWNVGGLTNNILDELQVWLSQEANQNIQVVMLQETRWTFSSEWANEHWTFIHTGLKTHRGSGVLTMVSTRLCSSRQVRHTEVQPGRVLHTRIPLTRQGNSLDIVNVYQFPWDFQAPTVELLNKRYNLLQNVEKTVKSVPVRNLCICGGDMNVQLTHMHGLIGTATYLGESTRQTATDAEALREVLQARQLVALNTWSGPRRTVYTFEQQRQEALSRSQIDYLFVRHHQVTTLMRKCKPLAAFPVTAWRASGLHKPLLLSVDYRWKPPLKRGAPSSAQVDAEAVKDGMRQGTEWYMQFQSELQAGLATLAGVNMDTINTLILNIGYKYYPKSRQHRPAYFQSQQVQKVVRTRWQHLAEMRKYSRFGLPKLFLFWKHFAKFRALRRAANKASRTARRDRVDGLLCEAEHFARMNNVHRLYKIVRLLAPKQPCKKVQIYDKDGLMLSNTQEAAAIHDHFCQIFQGGQVVAPWTCSTGVAQFTYEELLTAMKSIPINKATPPHMAPGAVWKAAAEGLADVLHRFLGDLWGGPRPLVPQSWRDGWLALLGKPGKSCRRPGDFRPLCLQDPVGKAVLTLITDRVRPAVQAYASVFPQHAYLPYRSTQGALLYVFEKLRAIRGLLQASKRDIYSKRAGKVAHKFAGGYVLSLDMSGAFDCVPREHIRDSLLEAGVAEAEVVLILTWLHQSTYHLQHGGIPLKIITDRGVRQGCVLSPLIWACYTCYILRRMDARICLHDIQLYADDFLLCKEFRTKQEMLEALQLIPLLMNHLRQFGLKINVSKTVMLVRVAEAEGRAVLSKYLSKSKRGTYFCVPGLALEYIPVKESHTYLGCIISLLDFETLTFRHRLQIGKGQFQRLRSVLTNGKYLSLRRRTRLWQTCVWSSISYGLACCGVSGACMRLLAGTVATQIRAIAKLPRHISRVSNDELYQRVYIQHPAQLLLHLSTNLCDRLAKMKQLLPPEDVMSWPQFLEQALYSQERIQDAAHYQQQLVTVDVEAGVACPVCGLYFSSMAYVKAHITRKHPEQVKPASLPLEQVQREEIAVDGMPVCKTCGKAFGAWRELIEHVRLKRCPGGAASDSVPEPVRPVAKRANLIDNWLSHGASVLAPQLANQPGLRQELRERCCVCHQWIASHHHIKHHIRKTHVELHKQLHDTVLEDCRLLASSVCEPCPYCELQTVQNRKKHAAQCVVLYQAAFACRLHGCQHDQRGGRLSLRGLPAGSAGQPRTGKHARRREHPPDGGTTSQVAKAQWEGRCTEHLEKTGPRGPLSRWLVPAGPKQRPGGLGAAPCTALPPSGRRIELDEAGPRVPHVLSYAKPGIHAGDAVQHLPALEGAARGGPHGLPTSSCPLQVRHPGAQDSHHGGCRAAGQACHPDQEGMGDPGGGQGADVGDLDVEPVRAEGHPASGHGPPPAFRRGESPGSHPERPRRQHPAEVPLDQASLPAVCRRNGSLPHGDLKSWRDPAARLPVPVVPEQLHSVVHGGGTPENGDLEEVPPGTATAEARLQQVTSLALHNPGNLCYQHSFVLSWIWAMMRCFQLQGRTYVGTAQLGRGASVITTLLESQPNRLSSVFAWSSIMQQWCRPQIQHDVGEFAGHALKCLRPPSLQGHWNARVADPQVRTVDTGPLHAPITMHIPDTANGIQDCVQAWHAQAMVHGLEVDAPLILIQLGRFRYGSSRARKYLRRLNLDRGLRLPMFQTGLATQWIKYELVAGVYHLGRTATSGHYRSFLNCVGATRQPNEDPRSLPISDCLTTDDGRSALPATQDEYGVIQKNVYLLWYARCP